MCKCESFEVCENVSVSDRWCAVYKSIVAGVYGASVIADCG